MIGIIWFPLRGGQSSERSLSDAVLSAGSRRQVLFGSAPDPAAPAGWAVARDRLPSPA